MYKVQFPIITFIIILLLTGCSTLTNKVKATEDTTYLTPIPEATFSAFKWGPSIDNKLQAVIAARIELGAPPHFKPYGIQTVIFAQELRLADAYTLVESYGSYYSSNWVAGTKVWLVVFEGDIQVTGPGQKTPDPPFHSCSYVIISAEDGNPPDEVGGFDCSKAAGLQSK